MPLLELARSAHACCAMRSSLVVIGGETPSDEIVGSMEMFAEGGGAVTNQPPLSHGGISGASTVAVDKSDSTSGQVLLLGGFDQDEEVVSTMYLVDLATGVRRVTVHATTKYPSDTHTSSLGQRDCLTDRTSALGGMIPMAQCCRG
jgi:hypothetical protein